MSNYFYDTEFLEDGKTIDLISIAIVHYESGKHFYAVNRDAPWNRIKKHPWLMSNVIPSLPVEFKNGYVYFDHSTNNAHILEKDRIRDSLMMFVDDTQENGVDNKFWAWYADYDHVVLSQLFGTMMDLPANFPMFTMDLKQWATMLGNPKVPEQDENEEHNALMDAQHNIKIYEFLRDYDANLA